MIDELWNTADVADYLRVPQRTVRTWWRRGTLPGYKLPGTTLVRFDPADIQAWVAEGRRGGPATDNVREVASAG